MTSETVGWMNTTAFLYRPINLAGTVSPFGVKFCQLTHVRPLPLKFDMTLCYKSYCSVDPMPMYTRKKTPRPKNRTFPPPEFGDQSSWEKACRRNPQNGTTLARLASMFIVCEYPCLPFCKCTNSISLFILIMQLRLGWKLFFCTDIRKYFCLKFVPQTYARHDTVLSLLARWGCMQKWSRSAQQILLYWPW